MKKMNSSKKNSRKPSKKKGILFYICEFCSKVSAKRAKVCKPVKSRDIFIPAICAK